MTPSIWIFYFALTILTAGIVFYIWSRKEKKGVDTPRLRELLAQIPKDWNREDFVLTGSATLAFRGIRDVHDLDVLVRPEKKRQLMEQVAQLQTQENLTFDPFHSDDEEEDEDEEETDEPKYAGKFSSPLKDKDIDVFDVSPRLDLTFDDIKKAATLINGYYVQNPKHTLAIKILIPQTRDKDRADILTLAKLIAEEKS